MNLFCILAVAFALMGVLIRIGKGDFLIGGFVRDMKTKRERYDMGLLRRFVSNVLFVCALTFLVMFLGMVMKMKLITWIGIGLMLCAVFYSIRYTDDESRFQKGGEQ